MTFNKKLIAGAVGGALTLGLGMSAQANHDNTLLFPYVVKDTNRTTVITIMGEGDPASSGPGIHLQYWTKSTTDANTAACQPNSSEIVFTHNDIVTFDTAGLLGYPLFGDTSNAAPLGASISYAGPRHGYLVVSWINSNNSGAGFWTEIDLANGGAHGDTAFGDSPDFDFDGVDDNLLLEDTAPPGNSYGSDAALVPFWPASLVSSVFTVTPTGTNMRTSENNTVVLRVLNEQGIQGAYDRNENGIDGTVPQTVRCVGRLTLAQLMPGVVGNAAWAAQGGWGFLANLGDNDTSFSEACSSSGDCDAAVYMVDTSTAAGAGKFMQNAHRIVSDND